MSNDNPNTERRPRPEPETRIEGRSASHAALQALETVATGAEYTLGALRGDGCSDEDQGRARLEGERLEVERLEALTPDGAGAQRRLDSGAGPLPRASALRKRGDQSASSLRSRRSSPMSWPSWAG
jgi:hypothetical protein